MPIPRPAALEVSHVALAQLNLRCPTSTPISPKTPRGFEDDLCELLRIPSVSADTARRGDVARAADWVLGQFHSLGLKTEKIRNGRAIR